MKFQTLTLLAFQATTILSAAVSPRDSSSDAAECGDLGVMDWSNIDLPKDVDRTKLRKCKEHPRFQEALTSRNDNPADKIFEKRACYYGNYVGCDNGWCWQRCNVATSAEAAKGNWCWMAWNNGAGDWVSCKAENNYSDCVSAMFTYKTDCGKGDCKSCGCGC